MAVLLILRPDIPRSLMACMNEVKSNIDLLANDPSGEALRRAGHLPADLQCGRIDEILQSSARTLS